MGSESIFLVFYTSHENYQSSFVKYLKLLELDYELIFDELIIQMKDIKLDMPDYRNFVTYLTNEERLKMYNDQKRSGLLIEKKESGYLYSILSLLNTRPTFLISFSNKIFNIFPKVFQMNCHDANHKFRLGGDIYQLFHESFTMEYKGLYWLNYFGAERMAALGGEKLFELPYATKIERLNGGIFIQIGDSPEEALTPEGEERLYKATEWVYKLVRGEESPTVQIPEYFKVKPEHIQEIQLSTPLRKGQDTLIDLQVAVPWSEQEVILPKIKVTATAVPQGSSGYYELMVILPQEVTVEGVTYQLDSETRLRVEV